MFELLDRSALGEFTDAALIDALDHRTRTEARAAAQRLAIIAEIVARHCDEEDDESAYRAIDGWEIATAAVSAACNLSRGAAAAQMRIGQALRERLPKIAAVFARGQISAKVVSTITWRTQLIVEQDALGLIDTALAGAATTYGALSSAKAEQAIDVWVEKFDPAAVRRTRTAARERDIHFGDAEDPNGTVSIWGRLLATDAALIKTLLNAMARGVCDDDPRTIGQRRSDALGAVGAGADHLTCQCGNPDCDATGIDPRSRAVVIHLLAQVLPQWAADSAEGEARDEGPGADTDTDEAGSERGDEAYSNAAVETPAEQSTQAPTPRDPRIHGKPDQSELAADRTPAVTGGPAVILGGGIVPAPLLAELIATGATVKYLSGADALSAQRSYRPSTKLAAYVQMRDLVCMFPGCGVAADRCDLDHSTPWPAGATHPGNLGPKCRTHHLIKTFQTGAGGWTDVQHPDGSHTWTAPTGHTYHTTPFSRILFPQWATRTPAPPTGPAPTAAADRSMRMPVRQRTRQQSRTQRINTERRLNTELDKPPPC
ncbi:HNH endonuclease signature motif containing protein [Mycolicibacterium setense]|uniref:HNH endonuclease signature motif containing protein n=1 Tax=Mycolicibacterium setense TaxID=431269 RepID=UPI00068B38EC|nr:HNH endonuclease signature motif containing protein [Mycolicibacterium setense]